VWVTSMESSITGQRCDICKAGRCVDPKNSTAEVMRPEPRWKFNGDNLLSRGDFIESSYRYFKTSYYGTREGSPETTVSLTPYAVLAYFSLVSEGPGFEVKVRTNFRKSRTQSQVRKTYGLLFPFKLGFYSLVVSCWTTKEADRITYRKERKLP